VPEDENVSAIFARVRKLQSRSVGTSALSVLEASVDDFVERYEHEGPKPLVAPLVKQRQALDMMIEECAHPVERLRLYRLAGRTSGLLAYMAVNRSRYSIARAYCSEAFALAEYANDHELQAWVRGTQSFCEYYAGDYQAAVDLARDGQRYAMDGPQAVRLAINGEARALGKLGDTAGVHVAVQRGYDLLDRNAPVNGVSPCISFGGYSLARAASNAVTAYVDLGAPTDAATHAEVAMPEFDISDSRWSKSLIRLDLAKAMALHRDGDPDEAASLVSKALDFSSGIPITSVVQRSRDFLHVSAKRWKDARAVVDLRDAVSSTQLA
jgi:tetratricopeptide (TPR) repeat protein